MADALDLGSSGVTRAGSIPVSPIENALGILDDSPKCVFYWVFPASVLGHACRLSVGFGVKRGYSGAFGVNFYALIHEVFFANQRVVFHRCCGVVAGPLTRTTQAAFVHQIGFCTGPQRIEKVAPDFDLGFFN